MKSASFARIAVSVLVIIALAVVARFTVFSMYYVAGHSMADTFDDDELIFVNLLDSSFERGDVVLFHSSNSKARAPEMKRIVGLPGEVVVIRDGLVYLRTDAGESMLDEPYLNARSKGQTYRHPPNSGDGSEVVFTVPEEQYFLLGDNRMGSFDSRSFEDAEGSPAPFIAAEAIEGTIWFQ